MKKENPILYVCYFGSILFGIEHLFFGGSNGEHKMNVFIGGSTPPPRICTSTSGSHVATKIIGHDNLLAVVVRTACLYMDHIPFLDT